MIAHIKYNISKRAAYYLYPPSLGVCTSGLALIEDMANLYILLKYWVMCPVSTWGSNLQHGASKEDAQPTGPKRLEYRGPILGWTRTQWMT